MVDSDTYNKLVVSGYFFVLLICLYVSYVFNSFYRLRGSDMFDSGNYATFAVIISWLIIFIYLSLFIISCENVNDEEDDKQQASYAFGIINGLFGLFLLVDTFGYHFMKDPKDKTILVGIFLLFLTIHVGISGNILENKNNME